MRATFSYQMPYHPNLWRTKLKIYDRILDLGFIPIDVVNGDSSDVAIFLLGGVFC